MSMRLHRIARSIVTVVYAFAPIAMTFAATLFLAQPATAQTGCLPIFKNTQLKYPHNVAPAAAVPFVFGVDEQPLGSVSYRPTRGDFGSYTLDQYLTKFCTTGFLVLHRDKIVFERYLQGSTPETAFLSASMSKTILALLYGVALSEHRLALNDRIQDILPDFADSAFAGDTVEDLLRMSSSAILKNSYMAGVASDNQAINPLMAPQTDVREYLRGKRDKALFGKVFDYNGAITAVLGLALRERTGQTNTAYLSEKIWTPMGAEFPGFWIKNVHGQESVQGHFVATLRDYARLGYLVMNQGRINGRQVVSSDWISQMTTLSPGKPQPRGGGSGYGLQIWLPYNAQGTSYFAGVNGNYIFVDPKAQVVIVHTGNSPGAEFNGNPHLFPLRDAIFKALSGG